MRWWVEQKTEDDRDSNHLKTNSSRWLAQILFNRPIQYQLRLLCAAAIDMILGTI